MESRNAELLVCTDPAAYALKLQKYFQSISNAPTIDVSSVFETLSLMVDIYQAVDFGCCDGLVSINNILILLLRDNLSMCVHCEKDLLTNLKNYLFSILRQKEDAVCPSLLDSSLRLLVLFSIEGILTKEEVEEVLAAMEARDPALLKRYRRCSYKSIIPLFIGALSLSSCFFGLSLPWYGIGGLLLLYLLAICCCMYWLYCIRIRHFQHSICPVAQEKCEEKHLHLHSLFASVTEQPQQHYTIDREKPAEIQVGDRVFSSGKEAIQVLMKELEESTNKGDAEKSEDKGDAEKSTNKGDAEEKPELQDAAKQRMSQMLEEIRSKPVPIPQNLRETLVKLQNHLEKSNVNPQLLETVKEDIAFFDEVVAKRTVSCGVCYKEGN